MRYSDIRHPSQVVAKVTEAPITKPSTSEVMYGTWGIKFRNEPKNGMFDVIASNPRNPTIVKAQDKSQQEAIKKAKEEIDKLNKNDDTILNFSKANINFNINFTNDYMPHGPTGVYFFADGSEIYMTLCSEDLADEMNKLDQAFIKLQTRKAGSTDDRSSGTLYSTNLSIKQIRELGLQANGRYALIELKRDDNDNQVFKLVFDSITASVTDKIRMGIPGLTVAVY